MRRLLSLLLAPVLASALALGAVPVQAAGPSPVVRLLLTSHRASGVAYSAEATTLFAAMTSSPNAARKGFIDTAIVCLKTAGVWSKEDWLVVMAAGNQHDGLLNWKTPAKTLSVVGAASITPDFGATNGGASASNYLLMPELLNAGVNAYAQDDAHYSTYLNQFAFKNFQGIVTSGTNGTAGNYNSGLGQQTGGTFFNGSVNTTAIALATGSDATATHFLGAWTMSRTPTPTQVMYKAGTPVNGLNSWSDSAASTGVPTTAPRLLWGDTTAWDPSSASNRMAYYSTGSSFSSTDAANEASCLTAYLTAIGAS